MTKIIFQISFHLSIVAALAGCSTSTQITSAAEQRSLSRILPASAFVDIRNSTSCNTETTSPCPIEIELIDDGKRRYCLAKAPQVIVKYRPQGNKRTIVWELNKDLLDSKPVRFSDGHGLIVVSQIPPNGGRTHVEHEGMGNSPSDHSTNKYRMKVDEKHPPKLDGHGPTKNYGSAYLPVIIWGNPEEEELCAAIDPKIVNVQ